MLLNIAKVVFACRSIKLFENASVSCSRREFFQCPRGRYEEKETRSFLSGAAKSAAARSSELTVIQIGSGWNSAGCELEVCSRLDASPSVPVSPGSFQRTRSFL